MKRALLVGADDARGLVAAARSLSKRGWRVGVVSPGRHSVVAVSRSVSAWHRLAPGGARAIAGSVALAVEEEGYDVVLPGGDAELSALSEHRDDLGCVVPYGSRESVRLALDKLSMTAEAAAAGIRVPATVAATLQMIWEARGTVVLKSASHVESRIETLVTADPVELRRGARAMRAAGVRPVLQDHLQGPLLALSVVVGPDGKLLAAVQQRADGLWPPHAGVSARARTVDLDPALLAVVSTFLDRIGWRGLAQLQFIETADGPTLIDVNGRCYGSLALASAAGVDLAAVWAAAALGDTAVAAPPAAVGATYQWLYGDLRRSWRESRDLVGPLRHARTVAAHPVWHADDVRPASAYARLMTLSLLRGVGR